MRRGHRKLIGRYGKVIPSYGWIWQGELQLQLQVPTRTEHVFFCSAWASLPAQFKSWAKVEHYI